MLPRHAKWGLDICGFAVVDVVNNTTLHLKTWQTPSADVLTEKELNQLTHYASLVAGSAKKFNGKVDVENLDSSYFSLDLWVEDVKIYSAVIYSQVFKRDIKLAIAIFFKDGKEITRKSFSMADSKTLYNNTLMLERFFEYNYKNLPVRINSYDLDSTKLIRYYTLEYNENNLLKKRIIYLASQNFEYSGHEEYFYNENNTLMKTESYNEGWRYPQFDTYEYDEEGNCIKVYKWYHVFNTGEVKLRQYT